LADVKAGRLVVEVNTGEPVEVSKEHSSEEVKIGEPVDVPNEHSFVKEPFEGSQLNGGCEGLVTSGDATDNDQITEERAINGI